MTRSCAILPNGWSICANWKLGGFRSLIRSAGQDKLTAELEAKIAGVTTKAELEDIYLPYKPKRRTKAEIACERGLAPLAEAYYC